MFDTAWRVIVRDALLPPIAEEGYRMGMVIAADHFTVPDLAQFDGQQDRHELLDGALVVTPLGSSRHQSLCLALAAALREYVLREHLGVAFSPGRVIVDDRNAYLRRGATEYWVVDGDERVVTVVRPNRPDELVAGSLHWQPRGAVEPLIIDLAALFEGLGTEA